MARNLLWIFLRKTSIQRDLEEASLTSRFAFLILHLIVQNGLHLIVQKTVESLNSLSHVHIFLFVSQICLYVELHQIYAGSRLVYDPSTSSMIAQYIYIYIYTHNNHTYVYSIYIYICMYTYTHLHIYTYTKIQKCTCTLFTSNLCLLCSSLPNYSSWISHHYFISRSVFSAEWRMGRYWKDAIEYRHLSLAQRCRKEAIGF